jgi:maltose alpha-D-glucosyltransferase/alpha-amylase
MRDLLGDERGREGTPGAERASSPSSPSNASSPLAEIVSSLDAETFTRFLTPRRWYGGKGRAPGRVRLDGFVPLPWCDGRFGIARLHVESAGRGVHYQLPLALRAAAELSADGPRAVLTRIEGNGGARVVHDATEDADFRAELARAFETGARFEGFGAMGSAAGNARWVIEPIGEPVRLPGSSRVGSAEQSNTSVVYGDRAILKLFRRLEPGENPDVEIGRFLTEGGDASGAAGFRHTPALLGTIRFEEEGASSVAGMLQVLVPGSTDAWTHILERGRPWFGASPTARQPAPEVAADAERLGRVTRELHEALASPRAATLDDFRPEPPTEEDVEEWAEGVRETMEEGFALLDERLRANALPADRTADARALAGRRDVYLELVEELVDAVGDDAGLRIRHHGDYHLGQVLRSPAGEFFVIDFEGEPARPLEERRRRHSPLRDVAGMLRSFAYAAATLAGERRGKLEPRVLEPRAAQWERTARDAFLRGYLTAGLGARSEASEASHVLPRTRAATDSLVALFETEKVFYELAYELNNRPDWVWIPMRGIARLLYRPETM